MYKITPSKIARYLNAQLLSVYAFSKRSHLFILSHLIQSPIDQIQRWENNFSHHLSIQCFISYQSVLLDSEQYFLQVTFTVRITLPDSIATIRDYDMLASRITARTEKLSKSVVIINIATVIIVLLVLLWKRVAHGEVNVRNAVSMSNVKYLSCSASVIGWNRLRMRLSAASLLLVRRTFDMTFDWQITNTAHSDWMTSTQWRKHALACFHLSLLDFCLHGARCSIKYVCWGMEA